MDVPSPKPCSFASCQRSPSSLPIGTWRSNLPCMRARCNDSNTFRSPSTNAFFVSSKSAILAGSTRCPTSTSHLSTRTTSSLVPMRGADTMRYGVGAVMTSPVETLQHVGDSTDHLVNGWKHLVLEMPGARNRHVARSDGARLERARHLLRDRRDDGGGDTAGRHALLDDDQSTGAADRCR